MKTSAAVTARLAALAEHPGPFLVAALLLLPLQDAAWFERIFVLKPSNVVMLGYAAIVAAHAVLVGRMPRVPLGGVLLAFLAAGLAATLAGSSVERSADYLVDAVGRNRPELRGWFALAGQAVVVSLYAAAALAVRRMRCDELTERVVGAYLVGATAVSLYGLLLVASLALGAPVRHLFFQSQWTVPRLNATFIEPLYLANYLVSALPIAVVWLLTGQPRAPRWLPVVMILTMLGALAATFSVGGWLSFGCGAGVAVFAVRRDISSAGARVAARFAGAVVLLAAAAVVAFRTPLTNAVRGAARKLAGAVRASTYRPLDIPYRSEILRADAPAHMEPGGYYAFPVTVRNAGTRIWHRDGAERMDLGYYWTDRSGAVIRAHTVRTRLPYDIEPGSSVTLNAQVRAPLSTGVFRLEMDMVAPLGQRLELYGHSRPHRTEVSIAGEPRFYAASITVAGVPERLVPGSRISVVFRVVNAGTLPWPAGGEHPVFAAYRWLDSSGTMLVDPEQHRARLPHDVVPGGTFSTRMVLEVPREYDPSWRLVWDMVRHEITWFADQAREEPYHRPVHYHADSASERFTMRERMWLWRTALTVFTRHPVFGVGPGNFPFLYNRWKPPDARYAPRLYVVNNTALEVLTEQGIVGFGALLLFLTGVVRLARRAITSRDAGVRTAAAGIAGGLVAVAVQSMTFSALALNYPWILMGILAALGASELRE